MSTRVNPFANLSETPTFTTKQKKEKPVEEETITQLAEQNNFPSRQPAKPPKAERRKPRTYRTGRNQQFTAKVTAKTYDRIYKLADGMGGITLGEFLERACDALEREGASR
jgi:hypothetical protein